MKFTNRTALPDSAVADARELTVGHATLERILRWGLQQYPRRNVEEIVTQDEYTHDVLVPFDRGLYLVYDVT